MPENSLSPMSKSSLPRRLVLSYASPDSYAPLSRGILAKLGYMIVSPEEFEEIAEELECDQPDLRIVEERNLPDVPENWGTPVPIIVLSGRHGVVGADRRIAGAIKRPAGIHELYRLMQQVLEDKPRSTPRVATDLPATATYSGREWPVNLLSLSENGCLIRSEEPMLLGARVNLRFKLSGDDSLELESEVGYQLLPDLGLIFHTTVPAQRAAISRFVESTLLSR